MRATLGAVLRFAGDGRGAIVRKAKNIIGTGMVETGKLDQHLGGDIPLAGLVIGVADLCAFRYAATSFCSRSRSSRRSRIR